MVVFFVSILSAFLVSCFITRFLIGYSGRFQVLDQPNKRSLHEQPTPRIGGLAIWAGSLAGTTIILWLWGSRPSLGCVGAAALLVGLVSALDDWFQVPVSVRAILHLFAGGLLAVGGLEIQPTVLPASTFHFPAGVGMWLAIPFVAWMINLYNFMDGMDGFASGMAIFGFGTLGLLGLMGGDEYFAVISWTIAAAAGGFLVWNFPPARIFMGDAGSSILGLMAAAMSLWGADLGLFPLWIPILVFSPFVVDATVTILGRAIRGECLWRAHRSHYYQRLVQLGWGHKKTVIVEYVLMAGCGTSAVLLLNASATAQWVGLFVWGWIYAIGIFAVVRLETAAS